jgi:hypothetical protein
MFIGFWVYGMRLSSGARKDLLVVKFCKAMFDVAKQDETIADADISSCELDNYIEGKLVALSDRLQNTINKAYKNNGSELSAWVSKNLDRRIGLTLTRIQAHSVNLEMLALWVLFINFCERDKPIDDLFSEWLEPEQYLNVIELLSHTEVAKLEGVMFDLSYEIIKNIKD